MSIQRATDTYLLRLTARVEEQGFWHLHHVGIEPPSMHVQASMGVAVDLVLYPIVNGGRWVVRCPNERCNGAQLASPSWARFLCVDCANVAFGGQWLAVEWPAEELVAAGEAALAARPDPSTRNWDPTGETVGYLLAENVVHGQLFDRQTGAVAGDIGAPQGAYMIPTGEPTPPMLPRGDR